jgi:hypothetical protein
MREKGELEKRSSGVDSNKLSWSDYEKLAKGSAVTLKRKTFKVDWKCLNITLAETEITLSPCAKGLAL